MKTQSILILHEMCFSPGLSYLDLRDDPIYLQKKFFFHKILFLVLLFILHFNVVLCSNRYIFNILSWGALQGLTY